MKKHILVFFALIILSISSCTFFGNKAGLPIPNETKQYALSASASSSYGGKYGANRDDNSPYAATGEPDVTECGDDGRAWATKEEDEGEQWIELKYYDEVYVSKIRVFETFGTGAIRKIELKNGEGYDTFWEGTYKTKQCPYVFERGYSVKEGNVTINMTPFMTDTVRITLDTDMPDWNEIDAVELSGYPMRWYVYNGTLWTG